MRLVMTMGLSVASPYLFLPRWLILTVILARDHADTDGLSERIHLHEHGAPSKVCAIVFTMVLSANKCLERPA